MAVSQEELVIHDCQVVCPQCLAVCHYEGNTLVVRDDSDAPYRHTATVEQTKRDTARFCHSCGKQLPAGISFCPYCGVDLNAPFETHEEPEQIAEETRPSKPEPVREQPKRVEEDRKAAAAEPRRQQRTASPVETKLRTMAPHYSSGPFRHENDSKPGTLFKVFAYTVIVLLLALLVYIIYAGASIEMPV